MSDDDVPRCEMLTQPMDRVQQSLVVGNKDLDVIANFGQLSRRAEEIWNGTRCSVPNENLKSFPAQIRAYPATDDSEPNYSNGLVF